MFIIFNYKFETTEIKWRIKIRYQSINYWMSHSLQSISHRGMKGAKELLLTFSTSTSLEISLFLNDSISANSTTNNDKCSCTRFCKSDSWHLWLVNSWMCSSFFFSRFLNLNTSYCKTLICNCDSDSCWVTRCLKMSYSSHFTFCPLMISCSRLNSWLSFWIIISYSFSEVLDFSYSANSLA